MNQQVNTSGSGYSSYQPPPPVFSEARQFDLRSQTGPAACIICGYKDEVTTRTFKKDYYPPIALLSILLAPFVGILVLLLFKSSHELPLPFCKICWKKFRWAERFEALSLLGFFLSLIFGVMLLLSFNSLVLMFASPLAGIGLIVWAQFYKSKSGPKIKKIDRKMVVIAGNSYGDLVFSKTTNVRIEPRF